MPRHTSFRTQQGPHRPDLHAPHITRTSAARILREMRADAKHWPQGATLTRQPTHTGTAYTYTETGNERSAFTLYVDRRQPVRDGEW